MEATVVPLSYSFIQSWHYLKKKKEKKEKKRKKEKRKKENNIKIKKYKVIRSKK